MKKYSKFVISIGVIFIIIGLLISVPGKDLTTSNSLSGVDDYSVIIKYVGGDAYNYIIGANLAGSVISGTIVKKTIFISVGALISSIGLIALGFSNEKFENVDILSSYSKEEKDEDEENILTTF